MCRCFGGPEVGKSNQWSTPIDSCVPSAGKGLTEPASLVVSTGVDMDMVHASRTLLSVCWMKGRVADNA